MKSPKDMKIIQIDITNACVLTCSNCTRMCGHHKKPYMMDYETFQKAIDSMEGFAGTVSLMGGEPTLHPEFEKFALYIQKKYPKICGEGKDPEVLKPMTDFMKTIQDLGLKHTTNHQGTEGDTAVITAPGMFSTMCSTYLKHFEVIQDTFKMQGLNNHSSEMYHQPALVSRKDLGIPDEEWVELRDNCWLQNTWSASVTPKGAFFCEIAGALDMLFDGPGGWDIEPGWWKRTPDQFSDQLHWCELCGFACETFTRNANDRIDDASPTLYEKLSKIDSPKMKSGQVNPIQIENGVISEKSKASSFTYSSSDVSTGAPYIKYFQEKLDSSKSLLHPENLVACYHFTAVLNQETVRKCAKSAKLLGNTVFAFCETEEQQFLWAEETKDLKSTCYSLKTKSYGEILQEILGKLGNRDYLFLLSSDISLKSEFMEKFKSSTTNPGTLLYNQDFSLDTVTSQWVESDESASGFVGILNKNASSLREITDSNWSAMKNLQDLANLWKKEKLLLFDENLFADSSKEVIQKGERCAIFGGGGRASDIYFIILQQNATCVAVVDSNPDKQGLPFEDLTIQSPDSLGEMLGEIDRILIGSPIYYQEMKEKVLSFGFSADIISKI